MPRREFARVARALALGAIVQASACASRPPVQMPPPAAVPAPEKEEKARPRPLMDFDATAYSLEGRTKSGRRARAGIVAADPKILPLGTRIRIHGAGAYSGIYVVADTGRTIRGHEIDIYIENDAAARKFGRRTVRVEILNGDSK